MLINATRFPAAPFELMGVVNLKDGSAIAFETMVMAEFWDSVTIRPIYFGGIFQRDPDKPLDLAQCIGRDREGNSIEDIRSLAEKVKITLEKHPDDDGLAIWNIPAVLEPVFSVPFSSFEENEWIDEIAEELIGRAFPEGILGEQED